MTDEELAVWGFEEDHTRQAEMELVNSADALKAVQKAVKQRRNAVGLSAGQAAFAVVVGQRIGRGESLSVAMRRR